ncbi:MAG: hypothetical protein EHM41_17175 [Chloroflexi bacterium]|nr:MAG: hypothetical protein EHM41_17175 [Chloroflexota bacterium]
MPAIQLALLKQQAVLLAGSFDRPSAFLTGFQALLSFYADRAYRPGLSGSPPPLLHTYNVPKPILRQVFQEVCPLVQQFPDQAFALCEALWKQENLECRLLTASILGAVPVARSEETIERVCRWLPEETDTGLIDTFFDQALRPLRVEKQLRFQQLLQDWLKSNHVAEQRLGMRALQALLEDPKFDNIPFVIKQLTPFVRNIPSRLRPDLLKVFQTVVRRSPGEAAYFLHHNLSIPDSPDTAYVARKSLKLFPEDLQDSLRAAMRGEIVS